MTTVQACHPPPSRGWRRLGPSGHGGLPAVISPAVPPPTGGPSLLPGALGRCWQDSAGQQQGPAGCSPGSGGAEAQPQLPHSSARPGPWDPCSMAVEQISTAGPHGGLVPSPWQTGEPGRAESCPGAPGPRGGAGSPPRVPTARTPRRQQHPPGGQCSGNRPEKERTGDRRRYKEHLADFRQARTTHEPRAPSGDARRGPGHPPGGGTQRGAPASARAASCLHRSREAIPMRGAGGHREG